MKIDTITATGRLRRDLDRSGRLRRRRVAVAAASVATVAAATIGVVLWNGPTEVRPMPQPADTRQPPSSTETTSPYDVAIVDLAGKPVRRIRGLPWDVDSLSLSRDRTRFVFTTHSPPARIATIRTDGSSLRDLGPASSLFPKAPAWSPDGTTIAFMGERGPGPSFEIHLMDADGTNVRKLTNPGSRTEPRWSFAAEPQWSPDGSTIAYVREGDPETEDGWTGKVWTLVLAGGSPSRITTTSPGVDEGNPTYSPDGSQIAYSRAGGIWVMGADGSDPRKLLTDGATPRWSPDGTMIAYTTDGGEASVRTRRHLNIVEVATGKHQRVGDVAPTPYPPVWWADNTLLARPFVD